MQKPPRWILPSLVTIDTLGIGLAMVISYYVRIGGSVVPYYGPRDIGSYVETALCILPAWLLIHAVAQLYSVEMLFDGLEEYAQIIKASTFGVISLIVASFWQRWVLLSRGWVLITWLLSILLVVWGRFIFRRVIYRARTRGRLTTDALIIGANEHAKALARQFRASPRSGTRVIGFLDDYLPEGTPIMDDLRILGPPFDLEYIVAASHATELIIVPEAMAWESFQEIIGKIVSTPLGITVRLSPGVYEILTTGVSIYNRAYIPLLLINGIRITGLDAIVKATLDYVLGSILVVLTLPVTGLIALALKLSGAPAILARHSVLGLKGNPITIYKFYTGVDRSARRTLARSSFKEQVFCNRLGRWLYISGMDKLPQLWSVLCGQISLVGTRPVPAGRDQSAEPQYNLLTVKPGMTGPWALTDGTSADQEERLTLYYIRNWNILRDIQLLAQTFIAVVGGRVKSPYPKTHNIAVELQRVPVSRGRHAFLEQ